MNRTGLVDAVVAETGLDRKQAEAAVKAFADVVIAETKSGEKVSVFGFGTFTPTARAARMGRNPQTNTPVKVPASKGVRFTPASAYKATLNTKGRKAAAKKAAPAPAKAVATKAVTASKAAATKAPAKAVAAKAASKAAATKAPVKTVAAKSTATKAAPAPAATSRRKATATKAPAKRATKAASRTTTAATAVVTKTAPVAKTAPARKAASTTAAKRAAAAAAIVAPATRRSPRAAKR